MSNTIILAKHFQFGSLPELPLHLQQFFKLLIKKGRGNWPCEALATQTSHRACLEGANSTPEREEISQRWFFKMITLTCILYIIVARLIYFRWAFLFSNLFASIYCTLLFTINNRRSFWNGSET